MADASHRRGANRGRRARLRRAGLIGIVSLVGLVVVVVAMLAGLEVTYPLIVGVLITVLGGVFALGLLYAVVLALGIEGWHDED